VFKIGLIGAGGMAGTHARGYAKIPNAQLVGVMDIREEAAGKLAGDHGARPYTDFDEMVRQEKPDIIDVCSPTPWHAEYVCRAAETGPRAIIVEKPMGRTVADCEKMISACEGADIPLFVAHVLRFFPEFATATAQVRANAVGQVAAVRTKRGGSFPRGWDNWYGKTALSGGLILDLIIHDFDWLRWTFGEVERVFAKGLAARDGSSPEVERDYALVTLRFKSGVVAHVEGTWADPSGFKVGFEIAGDEGLLEYNFNQPASPALVAALAGGEGARAGVAVPENPMANNPYQDELAHFLDCVEKGVPASISPQDGLEAVRIAQAATLSAQTGKPVIVGEVK
jgi:UDP-N-acetylglucosamine 3-dehydrogenase